MTVPNSVFLTYTVVTSPFGRRYVMHRFVISLARGVDAAAGVEWLTTRTQQALAPYIEDAQNANKEIDRSLGVDVTGPEPAVTVGTNDYGMQQFRVLVFCPRTRAAEIERDVSAGFLDAAAAGELAPAGTSVGGDTPTATD